ncbi:aspartokinase [Verticillium alfalfae VaMs.102]|uniref:Aspartate kinase FUB3 n=1 Tax=Verticillium alfalfae (strain VaMs.102 / ATCC MYA-4576 / FGSC 10136) TaxID=526221 RepID=C9SG47_VERA1|nr:aspartokinase [Verticillium alfalfae VaMs.102]EEY18061.1 aspartokinase [Verticillium alfalfae VaMs.102]
MGGQLTGNASNYGWVVQKFGGTSVGKFPDKVSLSPSSHNLSLRLQPIAKDIVKANLSEHRVVVVCSARSTGKKAEGTTSRLLGIYNKLKGIAAATNDEDVQNELMEEAKSLISDISSEHVLAVHNFIRNEDLQHALSQQIKDECQELTEYIVAAKRFNLEVNARSKDRVISFGEKLSCRFMAILLQDQGVASEYVDLSDVFHYDATARLDVSFYQEATALLNKKILACEDRVPVVTGFFGNVPGSLIDGDIGRGYTDLCAALCAVGMRADELQVWKEVDGIFTADPSKGAHGTTSTVIHANPPIPIRIKNVKNPTGVGTIVVPDPVLAAGHQIQRHAWSDPARLKKPKRPTAVTIKDKISVINVHSNKRSISHGFFAKVFSILDRHQVSVDLISTSEVHVSMAIHVGNSEPGQFDKARLELEDCGDVSILHDMAILSLVGAEMKNMVGIAGRMFSTLGEHQVNLEMISQGASEINISCVIGARDATRAMNILHTNLFTFLD